MLVYLNFEDVNKGDIKIIQAQSRDFNKFYLEELTSWGASQT